METPAQTGQPRTPNTSSTRDDYQQRRSTTRAVDQGSTLDQALCDFSPIKLRRTMLGIRSKVGKLPIVRTSDGVVEYVPGQEGQDPTLIFTPTGPRSMLRETERHADGRISLDWSGGMGGPRLTPRYASHLSRALLKSALGLAWLDHGPQTFETRFDHIREAVLGLPRDGFLSIQSGVDVDKRDVTLTYLLDPDGDDPGRMLVVLDYAGVALATDSRMQQLRGEDPDAPMITILFARGDS